MKPVSAILTAVVLAIGLADTAMALDEDLLALHWHPQSAEQARRQTLALAAWLAEDGTDASQWRQGIESRKLILERMAEQVPPAWAPAGDGMFAWLVHAREQNLTTGRPSASLPQLLRVNELLKQDGTAGRVARLYASAGIEAPAIWQRLRNRLEQADQDDIDDQLRAFWAPLLAFQGEVMIVPDWNEHALRQAERVSAMDAAEPMARERQVTELLLDEARLDWSRGYRLPAVWKLLEGLIRLTAIDDSAALAAAYQDQLIDLAAVDPRELRQLDADLPVILALMQDAAGYLAVEEPGIVAAMAELSDAYARLALFIADAAYYLDQPVREDIRQAMAQCNLDPLLVGPLPRESFEACLERLTGLIINELDREELIGGFGPFASAFLRREMGLVSWQRANYLDGHLAWRLQEPCDPPPWINTLEWSILLQYLAQWVPQRPVFFGTQRWQSAIDVIASTGTGLQQGQAAWLDCMTGMGSERRDPVQRLLRRLVQSHAALSSAIEQATQQFMTEVTRPGADADLDGDADQVTAYRPEGLTVIPCPELEACGARAELPVSRALLGLFPNAYLLADQLGMGQLQLCYGNVSWVDREARPARSGDRRVANYHGRLSFELHGSFSQGQDQVTVFRQRLTSGELQHYLFASSEPEVLDMACPRTLAGEPIASRLPENRPGLVPNRLTYFVSTPTTAEAQLLANWDRGAEWRDWFVTGGRVEVVEQESGTDLLLAVEAQLSSLSSRRERQLSSRMLSTLTEAAEDPVVVAMSDIVEYTALLRRIIELHYPRVVRHQDGLRALLAGDAGLLTRDRVRQMRDAGLPMAQVPMLGRERLESLAGLWSSLPQALREGGQPAPEFDYGFEQLDKLVWISRYWPGGAESSAVQ
jgi:hypothetical protein